MVNEFFFIEVWIFNKRDEAEILNILMDKRESGFIILGV